MRLEPCLMILHWVIKKYTYTKMEKLSIELRTMAREAGLCDEWFHAWKDDSSDEELFQKYKNGIDFSIGKAWLSNEFIKAHWPKKKLRENGIFVDDKSNVESPKGTIIVQGQSEIKVEADSFDIADIYVRDQSTLKIRAKGNSKIMVNLYDKGIVVTDCKENAKIYIYCHTKEGKVKDLGLCESLIRYE